MPPSSNPEALAAWLAPHLLTLWAVLVLLGLPGTLWLARAHWLPGGHPGHPGPCAAGSPWRRLRWALPALAVFAGLASQIGAGQPLARFDHALAQALGEQIGPARCRPLPCPAGWATRRR
jgi:undecaprenyl-diphosphatase